MVEKETRGLLMTAHRLGRAEQICRKLVDVRVANGALFLACEPGWVGAINTVLVEKGVRVSELRSAE